MTDNFVALIKAFSWCFTIPIALVLITFILRKPLTDLLSRMYSAHGKGSSWQFDFLDPSNKTPASLPDPGQTTITPEQVKSALKTIAQIDQGTVEKDYEIAYTNFRQRGIVTEAQLKNLSKSTEIINILAGIYIDLLGRTEKHPLDAVGFSIYGSILFAYGCNSHFVKFIEQEVRSSPEYREKHR